MRPLCSARLVVVVVVAGVLAAGCGSAARRTGSIPRAHASTTPQAHGPIQGAPNPVIPTPAPTGIRANPAAVKVIRAWSTALRRGDLRVAARYFALPSEFINGPDATGATPVITIHTRAQAAVVNATLPCGALFISADQRGRYVNALFRLTNRPGPGGGCGSGAGQVARTNFVIKGGLIVDWFRAPQDPGDGRLATPPPAGQSPSPPAQSPPPSGGPVV